MYSVFHTAHTPVIYMRLNCVMNAYTACSLVGAGAGLDWLVLVFYERKILLADWFGLTETNQRTVLDNGSLQK